MDHSEEKKQTKQNQTKAVIFMLKQKIIFPHQLFIIVDSLLSKHLNTCLEPCNILSVEIFLFYI